MEKKVMIRQSFQFYRPKDMLPLVIFFVAIAVFMSTPVESKSRKAKETAENRILSLESEKTLPPPEPPAPQPPPGGGRDVWQGTTRRQPGG